MTTTTLCWDEGHDRRELSDPTGADVESKIAALDGVLHTVVMMYRGDSHLAVGGSASKGLVVYFTFDNESFWQLLSDGNSNQSITSWPERSLVPTPLTMSRTLKMLWWQRLRF